MPNLPATEVDAEALYHAASDAFSDYVIPAQMTRAQWDGMLTERGFTPELSFVAAEGGVPLAYWLTGTAPEVRPGTAYAISVGTRPRARRRGLAAELFHHVRDKVQGAGFSLMMHEVIVENTGAVKLYEGLGYRSARRVVAYRGALTTAAPAQADVSIRQIILKEAEAVASAVGGWQPTWQNEFHAMYRTGAGCKAFAMEQKGRTCGYAVVVPQYQQITQLGVIPEVRRQGLASTLLAHLRDNEGFNDARIVNVPDTDDSFAGFANALGWERHLEQFEMVLSL